MKELEQKADELVAKHYNSIDISPIEANRVALTSVNHTIETLERVYCREWNNVKDLYNEQIELKKILEGRL